MDFTDYDNDYLSMANLHLASQTHTFTIPHMVIKDISTVKRIRKTCFLTLAFKRILV